MEKCEKFLIVFYFDREVLVWLIKTIEVYSKLPSNKRNFQTKRKDNRVFFIQCSHNFYGRFIKLNELGLGNGKGVIVILEGKNASGWDIFV